MSPQRYFVTPTPSTPAHLGQGPRPNLMARMVKRQFETL